MRNISLRRGLEDLALAVIKQAARDLHGSAEHRTSAKVFFENASKGDPESYWFQIINVDPQRIQTMQGEKLRCVL